MPHAEIHPDILVAKERFNAFFRDDLYGRFDNDENIILSRGAWHDNAVHLPQLFKYCLDYTLEKHWVGYSDSLGHTRVYPSLVRYFNIDFNKPFYNENSFALTLGNTTTLGFVYKELRKSIPVSATVLAIKPFYPSILKSIAGSFPNFAFVNGLSDESVVLQELLEHINTNPDIRIVHLSNFIGVEGRIYSREFWKIFLTEAHSKGLYVVIDEGLWYEKVSYPEEIALPNVVRLISPSKKYGIPGMKVGILIGSQRFIESYYEQASTGYGGPASLFFLMLEVLFLFEYIYRTGDLTAMAQLSGQYDGMTTRGLELLYEDFTNSLEKNIEHYRKNRALFEQWITENEQYITKAHLFNGINFFVEFRTEYDTMYDFFRGLITSKGVSVMPGVCFGDMEDRYVRISILEHTEQFKTGLEILAQFLKEHESCAQTIIKTNTTTLTPSYTQRLQTT